jgi:hypothetical protein
MGCSDQDGNTLPQNRRLEDTTIFTNGAIHVACLAEDVSLASQQVIRREGFSG